jgi:hypothetical protein
MPAPAALSPLGKRRPDVPVEVLAARTLSLATLGPQRRAERRRESVTALEALAGASLDDLRRKLPTRYWVLAMLSLMGKSTREIAGQVGYAGSAPVVRVLRHPAVVRLIEEVRRAQLEAVLSGTYGVAAAARADVGAGVRQLPPARAGLRAHAQPWQQVGVLHLRRVPRRRLLGELRTGARRMSGHTLIELFQMAAAFGCGYAWARHLQRRTLAKAVAEAPAQRAKAWFSDLPVGDPAAPDEVPTIGLVHDHFQLDAGEGELRLREQVAAIKKGEL